MFNKNRKRAIGIIASYLFGLSSVNCEFKDHSFFEPKWCDQCKHVYHRGDSDTCSHKKVDASFNDLYLQSDYVGNDGLLWFQHKEDSDKIFFVILRNKDGSKINSSLNKQLENYDFIILSRKCLEDNSKVFNDFQENCSILLESFNNAKNNQGSYIDWSKKLQDNPLDNVGAYLSEGGFVRNMCRTNDSSLLCKWDVLTTWNGDIGEKLIIAHESGDGTRYDVLETRYNRDTLGIKLIDRSNGMDKIYQLREGGMIFFSIDNSNLPSQYAKGPAQYICPLTRFPIVLIEPDKGLWLQKYLDDVTDGADLNVNILISDGKTANGYLNSICKTNDGWNSLMKKYGTSQSPEVLIPCRLYAVDFKERKWDTKRNNPFTIQP